MNSIETTKTLSELNINFLKQFHAAVSDIDDFTDSEVFSKVVKLSTEHNIVTSAEIQKNFSVSRSASSRWILGENTPTRFLRKSFIEWIIEMTQEKIEILNGASNDSKVYKTK